MAQRVVFTFDDSSLNSLKQVRERGNFSSMGTAVRESIQLSEVLQDQVGAGFTEVIVRNPRSNQEKTLVIPSLLRAAKTQRLNSEQTTPERP
jgi:hypothetical protein